ncbi:Bcl-2/adenovirus E1B -interacting protein 2-like protein [Liparis tanakae]|uniref:Bcl-2/adenovirus E1B-interacting protein 2-like protein n=1 Tax=Liparis tanakae TaxID=230148 RepID=A0A4Z2E9D9_9TELE|nr:Bcl-2/adenovirus E1B -interacting protein 2-like protein [Liparis tanakae]
MKQPVTVPCDLSRHRRGYLQVGVSGTTNRGTIEPRPLTCSGVSEHNLNQSRQAGSDSGCNGSSLKSPDHSSPVGASAPPDIQDMELREEWQDDGFPRPLPEDCGSPEESVDEQPGDRFTPEEQTGVRTPPPTSLALSGAIEGGAKKRLVAPPLSLTLSRRDSHDGFSAAALSATPEETPSLDINLEALETPSGSETGTLPDGVHELEWYGDLTLTPDPSFIEDLTLTPDLSFIEDLTLTPDPSFIEDLTLTPDPSFIEDHPLTRDPSFIGDLTRDPSFIEDHPLTPPS